MPSPDLTQQEGVGEPRAPLKGRQGVSLSHRTLSTQLVLGICPINHATLSRDGSCSGSDV